MLNYCELITSTLIWLSLLKLKGPSYVDQVNQLYLYDISILIYGRSPVGATFIDIHLISPTNLLLQSSPGSHISPQISGSEAEATMKTIEAKESSIAFRERFERPGTTDIALQTIKTNKKHSPKTTTFCWASIPVTNTAMISPADSEQAEKEQKWLWKWNHQKLQRERLHGPKALS